MDVPVSWTSVIGTLPITSTSQQSGVNPLISTSPAVLSREVSSDSLVVQSLEPGEQVVDRYFRPRVQEKDSSMAEMSAALQRMQAQLNKLS